jgi:predicted amidohydrolase
VNSVDANFASCRSLISKAVEQGCKMVFFPECFSFIGAFKGQPLAHYTLGRGV